MGWGFSDLGWSITREEWEPGKVVSSVLFSEGGADKRNKTVESIRNNHRIPSPQTLKTRYSKIN